MRVFIKSGSYFTVGCWSKYMVFLVLLTTNFPFQELSAQYKIPDRGDFTLEFRRGVSAQDQQIERALRQSSTIQSLVNDVNVKLSLTRNVTILFATWELPGPGNALWDSQTNQIVIAYSLVGGIMNAVGRNPANWNPNVEQVVMHEIAHALFEINNMTKFNDENEEFLADSLAFFYLSAYYPENYFTKVARYYESLPKSENLARLSEHLPDAARAESYRCWSEGYLHWRNGELSQCAEDFENLRLVWEERLDTAWK